MSTQIPEEIGSVYFLGIGGIGMSALARYFHLRGAQVSGYDVDRSGLGNVLRQEGIVVHYSEEESMLSDLPDLVVYTPAVPSTHAGMQYYRKSGVPMMKRSEVLGWISRQYACIAVAGTHGKTTTSGMIAYAMQKCGIDVTAFLGGLIPDLGGNFVNGNSEWLIVEADEYDRSFLTLSPKIAVVTAMDPDHLDIYGTHEEMISSYLRFLGNIQEGGMAIVHSNVAKAISEEMNETLKSKEIAIRVYGDAGSDYVTSAPERENGQMRFIVLHEDKRLNVQLQMPGKHNALNATAAIAVCTQAGIESTDAAEALAGFSGIKRRFEVVHTDPELVVIDDYAHHPEELKAAISAARLQYPGRKLTGVFQPHLYSRTRDFYREFAESLEALDECVLVELYPARELPMEGVSSEMILNKMLHKKKYLTTKHALISQLRSLRPEVLLLLGAGDLDRMIPEIIKNLKQS